jgi:hypothetical protein
MCGHCLENLVPVDAVPPLVNATDDITIEPQESSMQTGSGSNSQHVDAVEVEAVDVATPKHGRANRQSGPSKAYHNLTKAAAKWSMQMQRGQLSVEQLQQKIQESRVAEDLRKLHGEAFLEAEFLNKVLRSASKSSSSSC